MNILTLDASLSSTGYSIFKNDKLVKYGKICPDNKDLRLLYLYDYISNIIENENINIIIIEDGFSKIVNLKTGLQLAELRGCIKLLSLKKDIEIITTAPQHLKKLITGKGNSTKEEVFECLKEIYKNDKVFNNIGPFSDKSNKDKTSDIYDAIALYEIYKNKKIE